jgi:hypothetical protein
MKKIMRATLPHRAANTYYGQWLVENAAIRGHKSRCIDRKGAAAGVKFTAVGAGRCDFPGNRAPARGKLKTSRKTNFARANIAALRGEEFAPA